MLSCAWGESVSDGDVVYYDGTEWNLALADSASTSGGRLLGVVVDNAGSGLGIVLIWGVVEIQGWSLTPGAAYFVDDASAGDMVTAAPGDVGDQVCCLGHALSTTAFFLANTPDWGEKV
jgi:hypothetical protein